MTEINNIVKYETFKILHRKDIVIFSGIYVIINIIFAYLMGCDSEVLIISGADKMGAFMFYAIIFNLVSSLFLYPIVAVNLSSGIWSKEFSNGTIAYSVVYGKTRAKVFWVKNILIIIVSFFYNTLLIISSLLFYSILGKNGSMYTDKIFYETDEYLINYIIVFFLYFVFICALSTFCAIVGSNASSVLVMIISLIIMRFLEQIKSLKEFIPTYYINISKTLDDTYKLSDTYKGIVYILVLCGGLYAISYAVFKRKDIR